VKQLTLGLFQQSDHDLKLSARDQIREWHFLTLKEHRSGRNLAAQQAPPAPLIVLSLRRITAVGLQRPYLDSEQFKV
jgi:hypothetical protein